MKNIKIILIFLLISGFLINLSPHFGYNYPLHVDEWVHYQYSNHLSNGTPVYFGGEYNSLEAGFHYLLATLNSLGVPYLIIFNFFASLFFVLICLGIFILTRKIWNETAGIFAVLFMIILKTTIMILGPVFFTPLLIGLIFIPFILYSAKRNSKIWVILLSSLFMIHPPSAMASLLLLNIFFIILKKNYLKNMSWQILSWLIAIPFYLPIFFDKGVLTIEYLSFFPMEGLVAIPTFLGIGIFLISIFGIYSLSSKKDYLVPSYILGLSVFILLFYYAKIEFFIPYRRALYYLFLILSVPFGVGCSEIIKQPKNKRIKIGICILVSLILVFALVSKIKSNEGFYQIITEKEYSSFVWMKENLQKDKLAVLDPWKANAFTPLTGIEVYSRIVQGPDEIYEKRNKEIEEFFNNQCEDLNFLRRNNISFIYGNCKNQDLKEIYPNVHILN